MLQYPERCGVTMNKPWEKHGESCWLRQRDATASPWPRFHCGEIFVFLMCPPYSFCLAFTITSFFVLSQPDGQSPETLDKSRHTFKCVTFSPICWTKISRRSRGCWERNAGHCITQTQFKADSLFTWLKWLTSETANSAWNFQTNSSLVTNLHLNFYTKMSPF